MAGDGAGGRGRREKRRGAPALAGHNPGRAPAGGEGWRRRARARLLYAASADDRRRRKGQKEDGSVSFPAPAKAPPTRARPFFRARGKAAVRRGAQGEREEAGRRPLRLEWQRSVRSEGKRRRKKAEDKAAAPPLPLRSKMSRAVTRSEARSESPLKRQG